MSIKYFLTDVNIKMYYISMLISIKLNFITYKIEKVFVWINKIYLSICTNLIIYVIVTKFLIIQYIFIIS